MRKRISILLFAVSILFLGSIIPINATDESSEDIYMSNYQNMKVGDIIEQVHGNSTIKIELVEMREATFQEILEYGMFIGTYGWTAGNYPANTIYVFKASAENLTGKYSFQYEVYNATINDVFNAYTYSVTGFNSNINLGISQKTATNSKYARASMTWYFNSGMASSNFYLTVEINVNRQIRVTSKISN